MFLYFTLFSLLFIFVSSSPLADKSKADNETYKIQAVLIAGSKKFGNYRHQADVCHAYHVLRDHGVPDENIIVFMYDDIANNPLNPIPGKIYNIPNGPDVYEGVPKDYTGDDVSVANFLGALKGDKTLAAKGKKVLTTGPNDHVFIYFSGHGGTSTLGMPNEDLFANDLNDTLIYMNRNNLYGKLTFYVEACFAGSMFENILPDNINIFVTTASNANETSHVAYCKVPGPLNGTCLGDEYSVAWLQDSDKQDLNTETLRVQFENVVKNTHKSHPQQYGQKSLGNLAVGQFQGEKPSSNKVRPIDSGHVATDFDDFSSFKDRIKESTFVPARDQVDSRDVSLYQLESQIRSTNNLTQVAILKKQYDSMVAGRKFLKQAITNVISDLCTSGYCSNVDQVFNEHKSLHDHSSYWKVIETFRSKCINLGKNTDALKYLYTFANLVEENKFNESKLGAFLTVLEKSCPKHFANNQFKEIV